MNIIIKKKYEYSTRISYLLRCIQQYIAYNIYSIHNNHNKREREKKKWGILYI